MKGKSLNDVLTSSDVETSFINFANFCVGNITGEKRLILQ